MAGTLTGLLHAALGIPAILAGILTQLILYSINLTVLGGKPLVQISAREYSLMLNMGNNLLAIAVAAGLIVGVIVLLWLFFYTEVGLTLKSTGDNPDMSRAQGINVKRNKVVVGGVDYIIYNFVILLGLKTDFLKMLSAIIFAVFLAVPYLKKEYFTKQKPLRIDHKKQPESDHGGDANA